MTDRDTVADWVGRYLTAWDSNDPADVRALFAPDAEYRTEPYAVAATGHDAITAMWLDKRDEAGDHAFSWEALAVDGDVAVVQGRTEYLTGEEGGKAYDNLWVIRLSGDGRARSFTEWYLRRPGAGPDATT